MKPEFRNIKNHRVCSQLDLAATLLNQLQCDSRLFNWSNNLMNPYTQQFAAYTFDEGIGWVRPGEHLVFHVGGNRLDYMRVSSETRKALLIKEAKAYLQRITEVFETH
jgi:phosphoglycerol transferase MdoB-like AlkP superfamily enzyme